jgi:hypothetical protein
MQSFFAKLKFRSWTIPLALLALGFLAFGVMCPRLGFYWDDWAKILVHRVFGLSGYWPYYAEDRPISGWTHIVFTALIGDTPANWQYLNLALRWLTALGICWTMTGLWPKARRQAVYTALLFMVYPVFTQQPISVTFHQQWLQYALCFLSFGAMLQAFRRPERFWPYTLLSIAALAAQLTVTEYFIGVELLRPVLLWFLLAGQGKKLSQRLWQTLRAYAPYLLATAAYVIWRLFFIKLSGDDPYRAETLYNFFNSPVQTLIYLAKLVVVESFYTWVSGWAQIFEITRVQDITSFDRLTWIIGIAAALLLAIYLYRLDAPDTRENGEDRTWLRQALVVAVLATLGGCLPAWITGRQVIDDFHSNRYAMPAMFGASLLWVVMLYWLARGKLQQVALLGALIAMLVPFQLRIARDYADLWDSQKNFLWQLSWRAPSIQPDTALISEEEPFANQGLFSTSASLNLMYPQPEGAKNLAYWVYTLRPRYSSDSKLPEQMQFKSQFRTLTFEGQTPNSLMVYYSPERTNCLWVPGPDDAENPDLPELMKKTLEWSNLSRITSTPAAGYPPVELIGGEPAHEWCYTYQKAELARQAEDWDEVARLGQQALQMGLQPTDAYFKTPREWLPFIEGFARGNRVEDAQKLSLAVLEKDSRYQPMLCSLWQRARPDQIPEQLNCGG